MLSVFSVACMYEGLTRDPDLDQGNVHAQMYYLMDHNYNIARRYKQQINLGWVVPDATISRGMKKYGF